MELLRRYNQNPQFAKNFIQKALTAASASGGPLTPQILERLVTNTIILLAPEIAMITPKMVAGKYAEFNRLTALPAGRRTMGDGATTPISQSAYVRTGRNLKVLRGKGAVTVFLQDASRDYIDVVAQEMENHLMAHIHDFITELYFGNENVDQYQWTGLDSIIGANGFGNRVNQAQGGAAVTGLKVLDDMIDSNTRRQGARHRKAFVMSPEMLSAISRILSNVRLVQNMLGDGLKAIEVNGGWRLQAYRNIPIIESARMRPQTTMPTVTATGANSGGSIASGTYYFRVSFIDWNGESLASAAASAATTGTGTMALSWTKASVPNLGPVAAYKIYCSSSADSGTPTEKLVCIIPAVLYDTNQTPQDDVIQVRFTTDPTAINPTIDQINSTAPGATASGGGVVPTITQSVASYQANDVPLVSTGGYPMENILLWDLDEIQGTGRFAYTNTDGSRFKGLVTLEPLAKTDDNLPFMVKTYGTLIDAFEGTCYINRGLRVA